jgi:hypothetical protein
MSSLASELGIAGTVIDTLDWAVIDHLPYALAEQIKQDFQCERIVCEYGWIMSLTEANYLMLNGAAFQGDGGDVAKPLTDVQR